AAPQGAGHECRKWVGCAGAKRDRGAGTEEVGHVAAQPRHAGHRSDERSAGTKDEQGRGRGDCRLPDDAGRDVPAAVAGPEADQRTDPSGHRHRCPAQRRERRGPAGPLARRPGGPEDHSRSGTARQRPCTLQGAARFRQRRLSDLPVRGPAGAFVLVGLETFAGTFVLMWVTMLVWRVVDRGHYRAAAYCLVPLVAAISFALPRNLRTEGFVLAALMAAFLVAVYMQRPLLEVATGALASGLSVWLILQGGSRTCGGCTDGIALAVAGTFFLGAVT